MRRFAVPAMRRLAAFAAGGEFPAEACERHATRRIDRHSLARQPEPLRRAGARARALETQFPLRIDHAMPGHRARAARPRRSRRAAPGHRGRQSVQRFRRSKRGRAESSARRRKCARASPQPGELREPLTVSVAAPRSDYRRDAGRVAACWPRCSCRSSRTDCPAPRM